MALGHAYRYNAKVDGYCSPFPLVLPFARFLVRHGRDKTTNIMFQGSIDQHQLEITCSIWKLKELKVDRMAKRRWKLFSVGNMN